MVTSSSCKKKHATRVQQGGCIKPEYCASETGFVRQFYWSVSEYHACNGGIVTAREGIMLFKSLRDATSSFRIPLVSFRFVSFRFVSFRFVSFHSVSFRFVSFRSTRLVFTSGRVSTVIGNLHVRAATKNDAGVCPV